MLKRLNRAIFIGAHPDDIELGCAGTILKYHNFDKTFIIMTCGREPESTESITRRKEQIKAAKKMGIDDVRFLGLSDGNVICNNETVNKLKSVIKEMSPDLIFTHYWNDTHKDHRATYEITIEATRNRDNMIFYKSYSSVGFEANLFVDISDYLNEKERIIRLHDSQLKKYNNKNLKLVDTVILENRTIGYRLKTQAAESFIIKHIIV